MELDMLPPRIQRLRLKTMRYQFRMLHVPGKLLATADTLSRITQKASLPLDTVELFAAQVVSGMSEALPLSPEDVRQAQESDGECRALTSFCQNGWPQKSKLPLHLSQYASAADELSVCDGVLLKEPLVSTVLPGRHWELVGVDLFHLRSQTFILVVDYHSRYPEVVTLRSTTAQAVIDVLKSIFARQGIP
ncbi:uncharacterized protein LOC142775214 [Rhipicephalus microplus]|uniref:uncharacterized protein LOC142775214 n=1 Tax=Rhipicephalus microplus TaxID=6941 RepID=UPI003F6B1AB0